MFIVGYRYIINSNILEMRKVDLVKVGDELYEIVAKVPFYKITKELSGDNAVILREYYKCEKILRSNQTNEYLFVNLIEEAKITNNDEQTTS